MAVDMDAVRSQHDDCVQALGVERAAELMHRGTRLGRHLELRRRAKLLEDDASVRSHGRDHERQRGWLDRAPGQCGPGMMLRVVLITTPAAVCVTDVITPDVPGTRLPEAVIAIDDTAPCSTAS